MKFISNKHWEEINKTYVNYQLDLQSAKEDNETYKKQVDTLININKELNRTISELEARIETLETKKTTKNSKKTTKKEEAKKKEVKKNGRKRN